MEMEMLARRGKVEKSPDYLLWRKMGSEKILSF